MEVVMRGRFRGRRHLQRFLLIVGLMGTAACDSTGPLEELDLAGYYMLHSIDGDALPHDYPCNPSNPKEFCVVRGGYIEANSPTELTLSTTFRTVIRHSPTDSVVIGETTISSPYTYTRFANFLTLKTLPGYGSESFTIVLGRDGISHVTEGPVRRRFLYVPAFRHG